MSQILLYVYDNATLRMTVNHGMFFTYLNFIAHIRT